MGACVHAHFACVLAPPISHSVGFFFLGPRNNSALLALPRTVKNKSLFAQLIVFHNALICFFVCSMINTKVHSLIYCDNFIDSASTFHQNCIIIFF